MSAISWNKLTSLSISYAKLDEDLIQNILSGSPLLETLKLDHSYGYRRIDITSKSVKNLELCAYIDPTIGNVAEMIEINAPNIMSLAIHNLTVLRKLVLPHVSFLVKAYLNYVHMPNVLSNEEEEEMLKGLILSFRLAKELTIGKFFFG
ncbi:F-box protein-like protein [Tanacetum coccineum]